MLGKLLKYDFKAMARSLLPLYVLTIAFGLFNRFTEFLANKFSFFKVIDGMVLVAFVILLFGCFIYTFIVSIQRFYNNLIKDEGYLTHTLPVKKSTIINSKLISSMIFLFISILVVIIALLVRIYTPGMLEPVFDSFKTFINNAGYNGALLLLYIIIMMIISYASNLLMFYLSICLGQMENERKGLYSVVFGIAVYTVSQVVSSVLLFGAMYLNKGFIEELNKTVPSADALYYLFGVTTIIMVILPVAYYVLSVKIMDKKLNLE